MFPEANGFVFQAGVLFFVLPSLSCSAGILPFTRVCELDGHFWGSSFADLYLDIAGMGKASLLTCQG
jgi:hypothetical protein